MSENKTLSTRQRRFVAALAATSTVRAAAKAAGIAEATAWRYLDDSDVKAEITRRQDAMLAQVTAGVVADMTEARAALIGMMRDTDTADSVRVRAASKVLDTGLKLFELITLADRVANLEARMEKAS